MHIGSRIRVVLAGGPEMAISFQCACGKRLKANDALAGRQTRCPDCGAALTVPIPLEDHDLEPAPDAGYAVATSSWQPSPATPQPAPAARPTPFQSELPTYDTSGTSVREFLYLVLVLALVPLGVSLLSRDDETVMDRLQRVMKHADPEVRSKVQAIVNSNEHATLDDLLAALPGGRLDESAHLPRKTSTHWVYGTIAALAFLALIVALFPSERKQPHHLFLVGLATGTVGIILLLGFQYVAGATQGVWLRGRSIIVVLFYIAKFIGWSYASASDPNSNFLLSLVGFTCGVGLCEELSKATPVLIAFHRDPRLGWRGACTWGLASGVGFGVSEGIMYSANQYNGISPADAYIVRFVSCVALHAIWTASVGIAIWRHQGLLQQAGDGGAYSMAVLRMLLVPMILHGLYDTLLKKDMNAVALLVGLVSFAWFVRQVESARAETAETSPPAWARMRPA
jgi:RsiW-degrading membrane proteinase PrsW (M82 family)